MAKSKLHIYWYLFQQKARTCSVLLKACNFIRKMTPAQVFCSEILKNNCFYRTPLDAALDGVWIRFPASIYLLKVTNRSTRKRCEICLKLTIKTPKRRQWRCSVGGFFCYTLNIRCVLDPYSNCPSPHSHFILCVAYFVWTLNMSGTDLAYSGTGGRCTKYFLSAKVGLVEKTKDVLLWEIKVPWKDWYKQLAFLKRCYRIIAAYKERQRLLRACYGDGISQKLQALSRY